MTTSSREALARGDVRALVESIGADEEWPSPDGGYLARVGLTSIAIAPSGEVGIHAHDSEADAVECHRHKVATLTELHAAMAQGPAALMAVLARLTGEQASDNGEATVPLPGRQLPAVGRAPVPVSEVSATPPPTGLYL